MSLSLGKNGNQLPTISGSSLRNSTVSSVRDQTEELLNWRDNSSYLYDRLLTHVLEWPSLSVQVIPSLPECNYYSENVSGETKHMKEEEEDDEEEIIQSLLLGTHTSEGEENSLFVLDVLVPKNVNGTGVDRNYAIHSDYSGFKFGKATTKFKLRYSLAHPVGEPNRIRAMVQNPEVFATISVGGSVTVFDTRAITKTQETDDEKKLDVTQLASLSLVGHEFEGWGLNWSTMKEGWLASGADDHHVCIWDTHMKPFEKHEQNVHNLSSSQSAVVGTLSSISPVVTFTGHTGPVQDVVWHPSHESLLISVGDDGKCIIWDTRQKEPTYMTNTVVAKPINAVSINPFRAAVFATGGVDKEIALWDMRNPSVALYRMSGHESTVSRIEWSSSSERYLASSGSDRFVLVWDLYSIGTIVAVLPYSMCVLKGKELSTEDTADGPPELLFTHAGHTGIVNDICWNPNADFDMTMCSVSDDNQLHIWTMGDVILSDGSDGEEEEDDDFLVE